MITKKKDYKIWTRVELELKSDLEFKVRSGSELDVVFESWVGVTKSKSDLKSVFL